MPPHPGHCHSADPQGQQANLTQPPDCHDIPLCPGPIKPSGFFLSSSLLTPTPPCFLTRPLSNYQQCKVLNPTTLLPTPPQSRTPLHSCTATLDLTLKPFSHILDQHIMGASNCFINGSSHKTFPYQVVYAIIEGYHDDNSCFPP
jgi:hypothetical protein